MLHCLHLCKMAIGVVFGSEALGTALFLIGTDGEALTALCIHYMVGGVLKGRLDIGLASRFLSVLMARLFS